MISFLGGQGQDWPAKRLHNKRPTFCPQYLQHQHSKRDLTNEAKESMRQKKESTDKEVSVKIFEPVIGLGKLRC